MVCIVNSSFISKPFAHHFVFYIFFSVFFSFVSGSALPAPTNIQLRHVSPTAILVSWDPPPSSSSSSSSSSISSIAAYRIYYSKVALEDMEEWQSMEISSVFHMVEINRLETNSVYVVRVRAMYDNGQYGDFSEIKTTDKDTQGRSSHQHYKFIILVTSYEFIRDRDWPIRF